MNDPRLTLIISSVFPPGKATFRTELASVSSSHPFGAIAVESLPLPHDNKQRRDADSNRLHATFFTNEKIFISRLYHFLV